MPARWSRAGAEYPLSFMTHLVALMTVPLGMHSARKNINKRHLILGWASSHDDFSLSRAYQSADATSFAVFDLHDLHEP